MAAILLWIVVLPCWSQLQITEFMASNTRTLKDDYGQYEDWVELYNTGPTTLNVAGWSLTDEAANLTKWRLPATNIASGGFLVVFASGRDRRVPGATLHANFKLSDQGDYLALVEPNGVVKASEFVPTYPPQYADVSYGIGQTRVLLDSEAQARIKVPTDAMLGRTWVEQGFDDSAWTRGTNGVGYETVVPGFAVRVVKANVPVDSMEAADAVLATPAQQEAVFTENAEAINYFNSGGAGNYGEDRPFPGLEGDVEDFVVEATGVLSIPASGDWTFGVNSDDGFRLELGSFAMSYPSPRGPGDTVETFRFAQAGEYPVRLVFYERGGGSEVEFWAARGNYGFWDPSAFRLVGDTVHGGLSVVSTPLGTGSGGGYRPQIRTDVQAEMLNRQVSAYVRLPFQASGVAALEGLALNIRYDDGFVAYLNGTEVARRNAPVVPAWNLGATAAHSGATPERIDLSPFRNHLREGANVLALQGLNESATSTDFLLRAELAEFRIGGQAFGYATAATPGAANARSYPGLVAPVVFSRPGGVLTNNIQLTLSCPTPGVTIRYTLDNRAPNETSTVYSGPISITGSVAVRARAFAAGWLASPMRTETYTLLDANVQTFSSRLPLIIINTYGRTLVPDMAERVPATITVIDTAKSSGRATLRDKPDYHGRAGIEGRGQTSWGFPKKPYNVELRDEDDRDQAASLLGMPAGSDWVLLNLYNDKTFMNDFLAHELFEQMGQYAVRRRHVEVFLNGTRPEGGGDGSSRVRLDDYVGVYLLLEKIRISPQRLDIAELTPADTAEPEISGGYIFKKDKDSPGDVNFSTSSGQSLKFHDPKGQDLTGGQRTWLRNHLNAFETALYGPNWRDPNQGYARYIDVDSFVDNHWIVEFTKQIDGYRLSNYLHKDRGGKVKMAPIWDWNLSFGNANYYEGEFTQGWYWPVISSSEHIWLRRLIAEPGDIDFRQKIADRWSILRTNIFAPARLLARINELAAFLDEAQARDFQRWPRLGSYIWPNPSGLASARTYPEVLAWTKGWLTSRFAWIDSQYLRSPTATPGPGPIQSGTRVTLSAPLGAIYYTLNGTDPRQAGGAVAAQAIRYTGPITIGSNTRLIARATQTNAWSGPLAATYVTVTPPLVITELMYHPTEPPAGSPYAADDFQYLELLNVGNATLDLTGFRFTRGILFEFGGGTLPAGSRLVLAKNPAAFQERYGRNVNVAGFPFTNSLARGGERITLIGPLEEPVMDFSYDNAWYPSTDGVGFSLVIVNDLAPASAWNQSAQWRPSANMGGSPGTADLPGVITPVVVNEILTHTDPPQIDTVELHNPGPRSATIGGWYLTDDRAQPKKYRIPAGVEIPPGGYLLCDERQFNPTPGEGGSFTLSSQGEQVYLFSADAAGNLTGFVDGFSFGASANGVTFGRYTNSVGEIQFPAQQRATLGAANAGPRVGPVVINEIQYAPANGEEEFVELKNITSEAVALLDPAHPTNTWRLDGIGFDFPANVVLASNGLLVLTGGDPASFRAKHRVPANVPVLGPFSGQLQDGGERLELQRPDTPDIDTNGVVVISRISVDVVRYDNSLPWPTNAAGLGPSLERIAATAYGDDPAHWRASAGASSPGLPNDGNRPPVVSSGEDIEITAAAFPMVVSLRGTAIDDGLPKPPGTLTVRWSQISGPASAGFGSAQQLTTTLTLPVPGAYVLRLSVSDGEFEVADEVRVVVARPVVASALVAAGSVWRYWDGGSAPPEAWRDAAFTDAAWKSGPAQLGYGDGDEATVVSFGPSSQSKYPTTYFRKIFALNHAASVQSLTLRVLRDDGVLVYLNGSEVFRDNLPEGPVTYTTWALNAIADAAESSFVERELDRTLLRDGQNVIAVELHQVNATSSDLSFDLALEAKTEVVQSPPTIQLSVRSGSVVEVRLQSEPGLGYQLEFKNDLGDPTWIRLGSPVPGNGGILLFSDTNPRPNARFYRVRAQ